MGGDDLLSVSQVPPNIGFDNVKFRPPCKQLEPITGWCGKREPLFGPVGFPEGPPTSGKIGKDKE